MDNDKNIQQGQSKDLFPTKERIMDPVSYTCAWIGGNISIGAFMIGATLVPPSGILNLTQASIALFIGLSLTAVALSLNGASGHKYGIPFVVQARSVFGAKGSWLPSLLRGIPALFWFGVQSWVGSAALNAVTARLLGFDNIWVVFAVFQLMQALMALTGLKGIKWLENVGVLVIFVSLAYMLYTIITMYGAQMTNTLINIDGAWGLPFWGGVTTVIGYSSTLIINISDYLRDVPTTITTRKTIIPHWVGFALTSMVMCTIGLMTSNAGGEWDPIALFTKTMPDSPVLIISLIFIAFAQITTNMYNNLIPAAYVLVDFTKMPAKKASVICVFLSILTFPWMITTAKMFILFVQVYNAFLGPIFAVMVCDYYFVRNKTLDIDQLYDLNGNYGGTNWAGLIAITVGALAGLFIPQVSWFLSIIPGMVTYWLLMKLRLTSPKFLTGTVFEKKIQREGA